MSYTFRQRKNPNNRHSISDVRVRVDDEVTLPELLEEFRLFLSACGFYVPAGSTLCLVEPDEEPPASLPTTWDDETKEEQLWAERVAQNEAASAELRSNLGGGSQMSTGGGHEL